MPSPSSRRASDPFRDNLAVDRSLPLPPPKEDMLSAVRDSVTVRPVSEPRAKVGKSNTSNGVGSGNTTPPRSRRSASTDSAPSPVEKPPKSRSKASKKASMHADIIDRLDFSGVGAAMLHHDGPFDACAPSRNKHKHKAPMMAWGTDAEDPNATSDRRHSPLAHTTLAAISTYDSPYHAANLYPGSPGSLDSIPKKRVDALAEAWGIAEPEPFEEFLAGGGDRSASSSIKNGKEGHSSSRRAKDARDTYKDYLDEGRPNRRTRSTLPPPLPISLPGSRSHGAVSPTRDAKFNDDTDPAALQVSSPNLSPPDSPRRSRSFIQRIRKMRDAPNVPIAHDEDNEPSDSPTDSLDVNAVAPVSAPSHRPTHKHQTSFLGRFTRSPGGVQTATSPVSPGSQTGTSPPSESPLSGEFTHTDDNTSTREKELPLPPSDSNIDATGQSTRGLSRKTSLMKKVVKGVRSRGAKQ